MYIIYDKYFNQNEGYTIIAFIVGLFIIYKTKKEFTKEQSLVYFLFSIFIGTLADHTIGASIFDFYDVNDSSSYEIFDFLTYAMFGIYGYLYVYVFKYFKIKTSYAPIYILIWSCVSMIMELVADYMGVFHYKNGYNIYYSFPIYLFTLSIELYLYKYLSRDEQG